MSNLEHRCGNRSANLEAAPETCGDNIDGFLRSLDPSGDRACWSFVALPEADGAPAHKRVTNDLGKVLRLNNRGAGVFFTINELPEGETSRKASDITKLRLIAADGDTTPLPDEWPLEPQTVITRTDPKTGEKRWQAFWRIDDRDSEPSPENIKAWKQTMLGVIDCFGSDPVVKDLPRVMRLPYTNHHKTDTPHQYVTKSLGSQPAYRLGDLLEAFPPPAGVEVSGEVIASAGTADGSEMDNPRAVMKATEWIRSDQEDGAPEVHQGERDNMTHWVAKRLADFGLSVPMIFELLRIYNAEKVFPSLDTVDLERLATGAHKYRESPVGIDDPAREVNDFDDEIPAQYLELDTAEGHSRKKRTSDKPRILAAGAMDQDFDKGLGWVPELKCFFVYTGTHWEQQHADYIKNILDRRATSLGLTKPNRHTLVHGALENLKSMTADQEASRQLLNNERGCIFNFTNGELHLAKSGEAELRPHNPRSYLTSCFGFDYAPDNACPAYDSALKKTFSASSNPKEMVRHYEEAAGFFMSPEKKIASMFLFFGSGNNGKTFARSILEMVLPLNTTLAVDISHAEGNRHFTADLPGKLMVVDDDVRVGAKLPDAFIKTVSENKQISGNPKGLPQFTYVNTAAVLLLSNNHPSSSDLSEGTLRRIHVVPFAHKFSTEECDIHLLDKLRDERSGIFNRFLAGLQRLLKRGRFKDPEDCIAAKAEWLENANPLVRFIEEMCVKDASLKAPAQDLFEGYRYWADNQKLTRPLAQHGFKQNLEALGFQNMRNGTGRYYKGLSLNQDAIKWLSPSDGFGPDRMAPNVVSFEVREALL